MNIKQLRKGFGATSDSVLQFLSGIKQKYNLNTPEDWNTVNHHHVQSSGGSAILKQYSVYQLKCMACPEGTLIFKNPSSYCFCFSTEMLFNDQISIHTINSLLQI